MRYAEPDTAIRGWNGMVRRHTGYGGARHRPHSPPNCRTQATKASRRAPDQPGRVQRHSWSSRTMVFVAASRHHDQPVSRSTQDFAGFAQTERHFARRRRQPQAGPRRRRNTFVASQLGAFQPAEAMKGRSLRRPPSFASVRQAGHAITPQPPPSLAAPAAYTPGGYSNKFAQRLQ